MRSKKLLRQLALNSSLPLNAEKPFPRVASWHGSRAKITLGCFLLDEIQGVTFIPWTGTTRHPPSPIPWGTWAKRSHPRNSPTALALTWILSDVIIQPSAESA